MRIYDVIILGAGASGLMCAGRLSSKLDVAVIEGNEKICKKLKISGGGKCNITNVNVSTENFEGSKELVANALKSFSKDDMLRFLEIHGIVPEIRKERYYFCQRSSDEIIEALEYDARHVEKFLDTKVIKVVKTDAQFLVTTSEGVFCAKKLVVATGGKSFATVGATQIGLEIAKSFGIKVKEFTPALVGLTLQKEQFWMKELSGLSSYVHIRVGDKILKEDMLFAHKGISGPAVLSASLYWQKGEVSIDFLPEQNILEIINSSKKLLSSALPIPKRLAKVLLYVLKVSDNVCNKLTQEEKVKLQKIHNYEFAPAGNFGFSKAEVSKGGVLAGELDLKTMQSKEVEGLYFIGEVVDVTGELGGYNFQWAFSSAVVCTKSINKK